MCLWPAFKYGVAASVMAVFMVAVPGSAWGRVPVDLPVFDVHTHYKWDQAEVTSAEEVIDYLDRAGVTRAVVIGTPATLALKVKRLAPERIVAFYGPYLASGLEKFTWQSRSALLDEVRDGLLSGQYGGIGELHLIGGMSNRWDRIPVLAGLLQLARKHDVPVMIHTEYSSPHPTLRLCRANQDIRILLAHAGATLKPGDVARILDACPNLSADLAARDPWRYLAYPITDEEERLLPAWRELILRYPNRFMIGSDTVWPVDRVSDWDEADTGWEQLERFLGFHRRWLSDLPEPVRQAVAWKNAERFFDKASRPATGNQ